MIRGRQAGDKRSDWRLLIASSYHKRAFSISLLQRDVGGQGGIIL